MPIKILDMDTIPCTITYAKFENKKCFGTALPTASRKQKHAVSSHGVGALGLHVDLLWVTRTLGKATNEYFKGGNLDLIILEYFTFYYYVVKCKGRNKNIILLLSVWKRKPEQNPFFNKTHYFLLSLNQIYVFHPGSFTFQAVVFFFFKSPKIVSHCPLNL